MMPVPEPRRRMSKWWWISLLIAWVVFVIIGGGLVGGWASSSVSSCNYSYYSSYRCGNDSDGLYYGGIACFAIAGILHLAYWIVLIVWCTQRHRVQAGPIAYINAPAMEGGATKSYTGAYPPPHPTPIPMPAYLGQSGIPTNPSEQPGQGNFCGNCGTAAAGQFCTACGART